MSRVRPRLVRLCARLSGEAGVAEDLAQEVLYRAWRGRDRLRDPAKVTAWLDGIARNVCREWRKGRRREPRLAAPEDCDIPDDLDQSARVERAEVLRLLDHALALLPAEARAMLIDRYARELPLAEIALREGVTPGAAAMRLQRAKDHLRRVLTSRLHPEAAAMGLVPPDPAVLWQPTRLWCPQCGRHRLRGRYDPQRGLHLDCPECCRGGGTLLRLWDEQVLGRMPSEIFARVRGFGPAWEHALVAFHACFGAGVQDLTLPCPCCDRPAPVRVSADAYPFVAGYPGPQTVCPHCGRTYPLGGAPGIALATPQGRAFARQHPRLRLVPAREVEAVGVPAFVVRFESVTTADVLELLYARDRLVLLRTSPAGGVFQKPVDG